jgi:tetratricopeptide (TPR) repeat protein
LEGVNYEKWLQSLICGINRGKSKMEEGREAKEWFDKGVEDYNNGSYDKAIEWFTKSIELDPEYANAYYNRGIAYDKKGLYDEAIKDREKARELNPEKYTEDFFTKVGRWIGNFFGIKF